MQKKLFPNESTQKSVSIRRWSLVVFGLLLQMGALLLLVVTSQQPAIVLQPIAGQEHACRVISVGPLTEAWLKGVQPGSIVQQIMPPFPFPPQSLQNCRLVGEQTLLEVVAAGPHMIFSVHATPMASGTIDFVITSVLAIIFALAGIVIFVRAQDRPTAHIAYCLFYTISFMSTLSAIPNHILTWVGTPSSLY